MKRFNRMIVAAVSGRSRSSSGALQPRRGAARFLLGGVAALSLAAASSGAGATTINFDDISTAGAVNALAIAQGYAGMYWDNFYVLNTVAFEAISGPSGYSNGLVSSPDVGLNGFGEPASFGLQSHAAFTLNDLYLTGAWMDGLSVQITGLLGGSPVDTVTEVIDTSGPTHVVLNWTGVDQVQFTTSGGVDHGYTDVGGAKSGQFALDNLTINGSAAPEPATWAMLILGLGAIGFTARRRRARGAAIAG